MSVLRLGAPVVYQVLDRKTLVPVLREGVVREVGGSVVWCGPAGEPLHRCDPVPYSWVRSLDER